MDPQNTNNPSGYNRELREDGCPVLPLSNEDPFVSQFNINGSTTERAMNTNSCGQGFYIKQDNKECPLGCVPCDIQNNDFNNENADMCSSDPDIWQDAQRQANIARRDLSNIWSQMNEVMTGHTPINNNQDDVDIIDNIKSWYTERLSKGQIVKLMLDNKYNDITDVNEITDDLLNRFKNEVSSTRGSTVSCVEPDELGDALPDDYGEELSARVNFGDNYFIEDDNTESKNHMIGINQYDDTGIKRWDGCDESSMFGPKNITMNEVRSWSSEQGMLDGGRVNMGDGGIKYENVFGGLTYGAMGAELFPGEEFRRPNLEQCINDILNEYDYEKDKTMINKIYNTKNINQLTDDDIEFIKRKLELMIIEPNKSKVKDCILKHVNVQCPNDLVEQMFMIMYILLATIGINLNIQNMTIDEITKGKLLKIIDKLGDLIPRALNRIIEINEEIGCPSIKNKTEVLRALNDKVFNSKNDVIIELPDIMDKLSNMDEKVFERLAVLGGIGLAVLKFI